MNDQHLLKRLAETDPYPADTALPPSAWSQEVALTAVEERIATEPPARRPRPAARTPGWLVAAAAFIVVLIVGGVLFATWGGRSETAPVAPANPSDTDVVQPTPTTLPTPTTVPPSSTPSPPTTATAPEVSEPQAYDATLTWDGQTCTFDGPVEARVGDTLNLIGVNNSTQWAFFLVLYMTSGTTIDDANHHFDNVLGNRLNADRAGWLRATNSQPDIRPPPEYLLVEEADAMQAGGSLAIRSEGLENLRLRQPREHLFVCSSAASSDFTDNRVIDNAPQTIRVSE